MSNAINKIRTMKTVRTFLKTGSCSESIMNVLNRAFDNPLELEEHGAMPLAGGIVQHGYQCGLLWGSALAAGARAYQLYGSGDQTEAEALGASKQIVASFESRNSEINCLELTGTDWNKKSSMIKNFLKGGPITCFKLTANTAPIVFQQINSALPKAPAKTSCRPGNCAAKLIRKIGGSQKHAVMASGFAGGIGLSGGACGALGAAIWVLGMNAAKKGDGGGDINLNAGKVIPKFLEASDYEFECSDIVGSKFESADHHASHVREGGCAKIIEALAEAVQEEISDTPATHIDLTPAMKKETPSIGASL